MARLNKEIRSQILENWTKEKWSAKFEKYVNAVKKAVSDNHKSEIDELELTAKQIDSLIKCGALHKSKVVFFKEIDHRYFKVCGQEPFAKGFDVPEYIKVKSYYSKEVATPKKQFEALKKAVALYNKDKETIRSIIHSVSTDNKLIEILPEVEKYMPKNSVIVNTGLIPVDVISDAKKALA